MKPWTPRRKQALFGTSGVVRAPQPRITPGGPGRAVSSASVVDGATATRTPQQQNPEHRSRSKSAALGVRREER